MAVRLRLLCLFTAMPAMVPLLSACGSSHGSGYDYRHRHVVIHHVVHHLVVHHLVVHHGHH
ncbi:MAG: hypothetical protein JWN00_2243 [Actinomycetia bacterium]|nr:hypothetical protein [Actinomycetes bacterium]